jgi:hypothetical protein
MVERLASVAVASVVDRTVASRERASEGEV